jgi:nucleoside phosphorylase
MAPPTSRSGFQIAFVTAVPTEYDALYELFDEKYDRNGTIYGKGPGDFNIYTTGKMGKYNVVLLCLADIGKMHAAQAVSSLRMSYLGIKYVFVVGICGGAPFDGDHPIYLGDVIISTRLIEYDYGRQYPGMFKLKDTYLKTQNLEVRNLHRFLSTEISKLDFQARVSHHLAQLSPQRSKPPISAPDILYNSDYVHRHRGSSLACDCSACDICEEATHQGCDKLGCEEGQIRRRRIETHGPNIHFGAMASADRVLKSGIDREWLTKTHGVLGFEMEGAGLWDGIISCTIIKGICDYADSHKQKTWQDFAAGTGAAATKAILEQLTLSPDDQC